MCGIAGVYSQSINDQHAETIKRILKNQRMRGPDFTGIERVSGRNSEIFFGHNRLAIIDLSLRANQPMWDSTKRWCITYNGEIYNYLELYQELLKLGYSFKTSSDTEVILNAFAHWGIKAFQRFNGPFAFVIYDKATGEIILCRDRFGVRPLYYMQSNNALYFASTTSVLAQDFQLAVNSTYIARGACYLVYEDGGRESQWQGLLSVESGCYLRVQTNLSSGLQLIHGRYYDLHDRVQSSIESLSINNDDQLLQLVSSTLDDAVSLRLRSDVSLGITLSSGLDSSSVAALVSSKHKQTTGFSFGDIYNKKTEGPLTKKCADYLNIAMEYVAPSDLDFIDGLFDTISAQQAPFSGLSVVAQYLLYKHIREKGVKVILGGQGGDEAFMGYRKYVLFKLKNLVHQKRYRAALSEFMQFLPLFCSEMSSLKTYWQHRHRYSNKRQFAGVLRLPETSSMALGAKPEDPLYVRQIVDIQRYSIPTLLRYEDRNAMSNSVESRLPFMDYRVVELGIALPEALKLRYGHAKWAVRQIMKNKIPDSIRLARYKRGFDISLKNLISSGLGIRIRQEIKNKLDIVADNLNPGTKINDAFSDNSLILRRGAVPEAIILLWIGHQAK